MKNKSDYRLLQRLLSFFFSTAVELKCITIYIDIQLKCDDYTKTVHELNLQGFEFTSGSQD